MYSKEVRITWKGCGSETLIKFCVRKRLSLCKLYLKLDGNLWANVIFFDETRIELYSRRRQYICRPVGQRFHNIHTMKTVYIVSEMSRKVIVILKTSRKTWSEIQSELHSEYSTTVSKRDMQNIWQKYLKTKKTKDLARSGRLQKLS